MNKIAMSNSEKTLLNLVSSLVQFTSQIIISFFLTPYIVNSIGVEANGFIALGNNFISFASLATIAVSSMAGRFITISIQQGRKEEAKRYYTSSTLGNILLSIIICLTAVLFVSKLNEFINIPSHLVTDVKFLFILLIINFGISNAFASFKIATFASNNLYLDSLRDMEAQILRLITLIFLFSLFIPKVFYVAIGGLIATIFIVFFSYYYKKKLLPELNFNLKYFKLDSLWELVSSGIWNTVVNAGILLLNGIDLVLANLYIGSIGMGTLSLSKTVLIVIQQLTSKISNIFTPTLTISFAKKDKSALVSEIKKGMRITSFLVSIPVAILLVYGYNFYSLWVPSEDPMILQLLSVIAISGHLFTNGAEVVNKVFAVYNKLRTFALIFLFSGILSALIVVILLQTTKLGIFAIAGVSTVTNIIRNIFIQLPLASTYMGVKKTTFYPEVVYSVISVFILCIIGSFIGAIISINSWLTLIFSCVLLALFGLIVNFFIVLSKADRITIINMMRKNINKMKR